MRGLLPVATKSGVVCVKALRGSLGRAKLSAGERGIAMCRCSVAATLAARRFLLLTRSNTT